LKPEASREGARMTRRGEGPIWTVGARSAIGEHGEAPLGRLGYAASVIDALFAERVAA